MKRVGGGSGARSGVGWLLASASAAVMLVWPLLVWLALRGGWLNVLLPLLMSLCLLRLVLSARAGGAMRFLAVGLALAALALCVASWLLKRHQLLLYYPVVVNVVLFCLFACSLFSRMSLVERLARLRDPALPLAAVRYTRRVTQVWCGFFLVNGAIALVSCLAGDVALWALWNGLLSYVCLGGLMAGEWLVRQRIIKKEVLEDGVN